MNKNHIRTVEGVEDAWTARQVLIGKNVITADLVERIRKEWGHIQKKKGLPSLTWKGTGRNGTKRLSQ